MKQIALFFLLILNFQSSFSETIYPDRVEVHFEFEGPREIDLGDGVRFAIPDDQVTRHEFTFVQEWTPSFESESMPTHQVEQTQDIEIIREPEPTYEPEMAVGENDLSWDRFYDGCDRFERQEQYRSHWQADDRSTLTESISKPIALINESLTKKIDQVALNTESLNSYFLPQTRTFLAQRGVWTDFEYDCSLQQRIQFEKISTQLNELMRFRSAIGSSFELNSLAENSTTFALFANSANRVNQIGASQTCLDISIQLLNCGMAVLTGVAKGLVRNVESIYQLVRHPIKTGGEILGLAGKVAEGLVQGVRAYNQMRVAVMAKDPDLLAEATVAVEKFYAPFNLLNQNLQHFYNQATPEQLCELVGSLAVDAVFLIKGGQIISAVVTKAAIPLVPLTKYKPTVMARLGEITQKGAKSTAAQVYNKAKRLLPGANEVEVIAGDVNLVLDAEELAQGANILRQDAQKIGDVLNKAKGGPKITRYRPMELSRQVERILEKTQHELRVLKSNKYLKSTYRDFYGPEVSKLLQDTSLNLPGELLEFEGIEHLFVPLIKETISSGGNITESIVGFHWDMCFELRDAGIYRLHNCENLIGGMYKGDLWVGNIVKYDKTFFPSSWDIEKLLVKISEACHNVIDIERKWDGTIQLKGLVEEGFYIIIKLNEKCKILTAYPSII